jgi:protein-tyrosine sulfotransferase
VQEPVSWAGQAEAFADPVFVVCNGRSGSTLLRFILDAHSELACPPETNLPALCAQLATVWSLIEGAPLSATRGDEPPQIPEAAIAGVRETMNRMVGSYLARRGKKRYCDKSLGTARYAPLLARVYPQARFVCVYRHPMDVIASGLEACPWGLSGYGFDPYIAATPGNAVMALASFWADSVRAALAVEEEFPGQCVRVRYEDLVADPEAVVAGLFEFLGVAAAPGISEACFSAERERFGPGDHKIWYTAKVTADSVGRGWSVPVGMIAPPVLEVINQMSAKLGYLPVDGDWGTTAPPADLRVPVTEPPAQADGNQGDPPDTNPDPPGQAPAAARKPARAVSTRAGAAAPEDPRSAWLAQQLRAGLATGGGAVRPRWAPHGSETFVAVAVADDRHCPSEYWLVDLGQATVTWVGRDAQEDSDWDVIGTLETWHKVTGHQLNLSAALRSCQLRYCDNGEATPLAADTRISIVGELLGVANWT